MKGQGSRCKQRKLVLIRRRTSRTMTTLEECSPKLLAEVMRRSIQLEHNPAFIRRLWAIGVRPSALDIYYCCTNLHEEAADNIRLLVELGCSFDMRVPYEGEPTLLDWIAQTAAIVSDCRKGCCEVVFDRAQRHQLVDVIVPLMLGAGGTFSPAGQGAWDSVQETVAHEKANPGESDSESEKEGESESDW